MQNNRIRLGFAEFRHDSIISEQARMALERFNEHHPDPNMPRQPNEQREQSDVKISSAESRERKSEAQFDQEDGLFKFEKRMKRYGR